MISFSYDLIQKETIEDLRKQKIELDIRFKNHISFLVLKKGYHTNIRLFELKLKPIIFFYFKVKMKLRRLSAIW